MFVDGRYDVQMVVPVSDGRMILMAESSRFGIIVSDNDMFYDDDSLINLEVIQDSYERAGYIWTELNVVSAKDGSQYEFFLATKEPLTRDEAETIYFDFEGAVRNHASPF